MSNATRKKRAPRPIIEAMGKLYFRTSYGQNVLQHAMEVSYLSQVIAEELGLNGTLARRAGLLHDIGKVGTPDVLVIIADFLNHVDQFDWVLVSGIHNDKLIIILRCDGYRKHAGKFAKKTFSEYGSAGGHREAARAELPLKNLPPRREGQDFTTAALMKIATRHL